MIFSKLFHTFQDSIIHITRCKTHFLKLAKTLPCLKLSKTFPIVLKIQQICMGPCRTFPDFVRIPQNLINIFGASQDSLRFFKTVLSLIKGSLKHCKTLSDLNKTSDQNKTSDLLQDSLKCFIFWPACWRLYEFLISQLFLNYFQFKFLFLGEVIVPIALSVYLRLVGRILSLFSIIQKNKTNSIRVIMYFQLFV